MITYVDTIYKPDQTTGYERPLYLESVSAGFPSPANDYIESPLDLNQHLIKHPAATFFVKAKGDSMIDAGIHSGDLLIVDRSLEVTDGKVVIAVVDGEMIVKRISIVGGRVYLMPENKDFEPIEITESIDLVIWGVVTNVVHQL
jgi:DNA polymerase V